MRGPKRDRPVGPEEERLFDLMREHAVFGLEDDDLRELDRLAARHDDVDVECYDRAAAALDIVFADRRCAPMPEDLRRRIVASAPKRAEGAARAPSAIRDERELATTRSPRASIADRAGWIVAAAATIAAVVGWMREPAAPDPLEIARELRATVDAASDGIVVPWKPTEDPAGRAVSGEVHWSTALQKGYMRFLGLPANDPRREQYQLWIFDGPRGTAHPVDGGVFDVATGEAIVAIDPRIRVDSPAMFAVTIERPGGVVVSEREHVVSLAQL